MDELSAPRMMPVAGWYLDPEVDDTWRYWDGARWTGHRAPAGPLPKRDPHSFSAWFEQSAAAVGAVLWPIGVVVIVGCILAVVPLLVFGFRASDSAEGREIRALLETDEVGTVSLTDAEFDRLVDLFGDVARSAVPWLVVCALLVLLAAAWGQALVVLGASASRRDTDEGRPSPFGALVASSLRRVPTIAVSFLVVSAVYLGLLGVLLAPMFVMIVADAGGTAITLTALFGTLAAVVILVLVSVRLSLTFVVATQGGHGLGLRRSWELTDGRFWGVLGRGIVATLIAGALAWALSFGLGVTLMLGFGVFLAVNLVFQAVTNAINLIVVVPSQVVLGDHLAERLEGRLAARPDARMSPR